MSYFLIFWIAFVFTIHLLMLWQVLKKQTPQQIIPEEKLPLISILLAVRNEEKVILRCLESLEKIDYPQEKIEILIGDDNSSDDTRKIIQKFIQTRKKFKLFHIQKQVKNLEGKSNALAQVAKKAKGEYFFLTDADTKVSPSWVKSILQLSNAETGVICGITFLEGSHYFGKLQNLEWLQAQLQIKFIHQLGFMLTTWGNNMIVKKDAYEEVGGYEGLGFSLTEDFQLAQAIRKKGYKFQYIFEKDTKNISLPMNDLGEWQKQRFRWWQAAKQVNWYWKFFVFFYNIGYVFLFWDLELLLVFFVGNFLLQSITYYFFFKRIAEKFNPFLIFLYLFYYPFTQLLFLITIIFHKKVHWKERSF